MCYILNIETATTVCSVSISKNSELIFCKELDSGFTHAENLHLFIREALSESKLKIEQLNAISVSKGPGSYTGLRIGVSTAKGFAYALNIPLISVDTLQILAKQALLLKSEDAVYCPMIDARRMEVYTSVYNLNLKMQLPIEAMIVDEVSIKKFESFNRIYFFGDGMAKCKEVLSALKNAYFIEDLKPSAKYMPELSYQKFIAKAFEDVAYFEPFYLKDFMFTTKKKLS